MTNYTDIVSSFILSKRIRYFSPVASAAVNTQKWCKSVLTPALKQIPKESVWHANRRQADSGYAEGTPGRLASSTRRGAPAARSPGTSSTSFSRQGVIAWKDRWEIHHINSHTQQEFANTQGMPQLNFTIICTLWHSGQFKEKIRKMKAEKLARLEVYFIVLMMKAIAKRSCSSWTYWD